WYQGHFSHQSEDQLPSDAETVLEQCVSNGAVAIGLAAFPKRMFNMRSKFALLDSFRYWATSPLVESRTTDLESPAHQLDRVLGLHFFDPGVFLPSLSRAKYAVAFFMTSSSSSASASRLRRRSISCLSSKAPARPFPLASAVSAAAIQVLSRLLLISSSRAAWATFFRSLARATARSLNFPSNARLFSFDIGLHSQVNLPEGCVRCQGDSPYRCTKAVNASRSPRCKRLITAMFWICSSVNSRWARSICVKMFRASMNRILSSCLPLSKNHRVAGKVTV